MTTHDQDWDRHVHGGLRAGDERALAAAYDEFSPLVYGITVSATGDQTAAEGITQRVFLRLWERPEEFDPERGPLRALLCELARRQAIDWLHREGARQITSTLDWEPAEASAAGSPATKMVRDALLGLPAQQRDAIMLAYLRGLSYHQVATELAIPEGTARSSIHSGLRQLATVLASAGISPGG
jgi:RNA polymerase sigma-70 factor (ECF subfamily)